MLRQLFVPKEFRIPDSSFSDDWPDSLRRILRAAEAGKKEDPEMAGMIGHVSLQLWRARRRIGSSPPKAVRDIGRFLDSAVEALVKAGVQIKDHTNENVTGGEAFEVLAAEKVPGLARSQVIETVRPTVYFKDSLIQRGQVIVGQPSKGEDDL